MLMKIVSIACGTERRWSDFSGEEIDFDVVYGLDNEGRLYIKNEDIWEIVEMKKLTVNKKEAEASS